MIQLVSCFFQLFLVSHSVVDRVVDFDTILNEDQSKLGEVLLRRLRIFGHVLEIFLDEWEVFESANSSLESGVNIPSATRILSRSLLELLQKSKYLIHWHTCYTLT